jgi:tRNA-(ms[2]io[6]A)-hydroxylase
LVHASRARSAGEDHPEKEDLPLLIRTPAKWAEAAMSDCRALLNDHAYLEKKAASNALELLNRWPEPACPAEWTQTLAALASDEAAHLRGVVRLLAARGGRLERTHRNDYAHQLRTHVRKGAGNQELVDRLLVAALIEARSCERFELLGRFCRGKDFELSRFYGRLWSSERGHYQVFLKLASSTMPSTSVDERWRQFLEIEAAAIAAQSPGPRIHSGWLRDDTA